MIALLDYGAGNLTSVRKALAALGASFQTPGAPGDLARVHGIIVPGVGHFGATAALDPLWRGAILERVKRGVPLFGICLGMQWLFEGSDEAPGVAGLGLLRGQCVRLGGGSGEAAGAPAGGRLKVPHVGWNALEVRRSRLMAGIPSGAQVYFTHSYAAPITADCVAITTHGAPFAAAVEREHVVGVQFHPEKSSEAGLRMIRNFLEMVAAPAHAVEANHRLP